MGENTGGLHSGRARERREQLGKITVSQSTYLFKASVSSAPPIEPGPGLHAV